MWEECERVEDWEFDRSGIEGVVRGFSVEERIDEERCCGGCCWYGEGEHDLLRLDIELWDSWWLKEGSCEKGLEEKSNVPGSAV